jgi:type II secretory pathway pseudopilin PulG
MSYPENVEKIKQKYETKTKNYKSQNAISLIALIISIIVIIILAVIVIGAASNTPESANKAKYLADLSEIQQAVAIERANNLIPTINNIDADINSGFTKVMIKKTVPGNFEDGWVVNLDAIKVKKSTLGNEYNNIVADTEITFGPTAPDIYVYDSNGEVYYSKGFKEGNNTIYSQGLTKDNTIVEPTNPADWTFDAATGTLSKYIGPDIDTLVIPNYINGVKVNKLEQTTTYKGITRGKNIKNIIISEGLTEIGNYSFSGCDAITSITIPSSVTRIGNYAFHQCTSITSITIPNSVTTMGSDVFSYCSGLKNVTLSNGLTTITSYLLN